MTSDERVRIDVYPDGDKMCAILGEMPESICVGFGDTATDAIRSMLSEMDLYRKFCPTCLREADEIDEIGDEVHYSCPNGHTWWDLNN